MELVDARRLILVGCRHHRAYVILDENRNVNHEWWGGGGCFCCLPEKPHVVRTSVVEDELKNICWTCIQTDPPRVGFLLLIQIIGGGGGGGVLLRVIISDFKCNSFNS